MMIFVPSTIETFDKLPDVQVGPDADAISVIKAKAYVVSVRKFLAVELDLVLVGVLAPFFVRG